MQLEYHVKCVKTAPGKSSDHSIISLELELVESHKRGKGLWKFNNDFLTDPMYVQLIKDTIGNIKDNINFENKNTLWDYVKCEIRSHTITYTTKKAKQMRKQEIELSNRLVVAKQLNEFISREGLLNVNQSAYKSSHSTETALLKIQNDIAFSVDSGKAVALTLLDLSAAFDTINHSLLYDCCMHDWFGLDGTVLWIKSYLSNRKQKIKIGDSFSESVILPFRVPQGSVLGPLLFTLYTSPRSQVISKFNLLITYMLMTPRST